LRLKWGRGKRYGFEHTTTSAATMVVPGQGEMKSSTDMVQELRHEVSEHEKGAKVTNEITRIRMKTAVGGMQVMEYDSADPAKSGGPMGPMLKPLTEMEFVSIYSRAGRLLEIKGLEDFQGARQFGLGKEQLELMAKQTALLLPEKEVNPGDTWEAEMELPLGPLSEDPAVLKMRLKLAGVKEKGGRKVAEVSMTGDLDMNIKQKGEAVLSLKATRIEGAMDFDLELGQPVRTETTLDFEVRLPAGMNKQEGAPGKLPMKTFSVSRLKAVEDVK